MRGIGVADVYVNEDVVVDDVWSLHNHPDPDRRAASRSCFCGVVDYVRELGSSGVSMAAGGLHDEACRRRSVEELRWRVDYALTSDVRVSIEPYNDGDVGRPAVIEDLLEAVPGLELTLDHSHFTRVGVPLADVESLLQRTRHLH